MVTELSCDLGVIAERTAGCGDDEAAHTRGVFPHETLIDCGMFGVDRHDARGAVAQGFGDQFAGHNHSFLVGKGNVLPGLDCAQSGRQAAVAHGGCHYRVEAVRFHSVVDGFLTGRSGYAERLKCVAELPVKAFICYDCHLRTPFYGLLNERVDLPAGNEQGRFESVGILGDYLQCLRAD